LCKAKFGSKPYLSRHIKSCKGSHIVPRVRIGEKSEIKKLKTGEAKSKYVVCKVLKTSKEDLKPFLSKFLVQKVENKVQSPRKTAEVNNEAEMNNEAAVQSDESEGNLDLDLECENLETVHGT
jgi:hypothetical protein